MATEVERKFLIESEPEWLSGYPCERIEQGYLVLSEEGEARVRLIDGGREASLTVKRGHGRSRSETEIELIGSQADGLWPATEGRRVRKRRFRVEADEGVYELDVFEGELTRLITCEIEFADEDAAKCFQPPEWVGAELTGDERYENRALATAGLPGEGPWARA